MAAAVFVVLVNHKRWADTIECMESLLRSDHVNTKVVVVDNDAADESLAKMQEWARGSLVQPPAATEAMRGYSSPPVPKPVPQILLREGGPIPRDGLPTLTFISAGSNRGFPGAVNIALQLLLDAGVDGYACLINNDMVVERGTISALVRALADRDRVGAIGGVVLDYYRPDTAEVVGGGWMSRLGMSSLAEAGRSVDRLSKPVALGYVAGGLLLARLATVRRVGLMDDSLFLYGEDADWGERMRALGFELDCTLDARVWHKGSVTTASPRHDYLIVRSSLMFVRKHAPRFTPLAIGNAVLRFLLPKVLRGQWDRARAVVRGLADYARGR